MAGNSVGTAYLTLVPKLDSNMAELEDGLEDAGKKGGSKFAAGLKGIAKSAAIVAAGKAVFDTFKDAFSASAEYEQLAGGVEKIFEGMDTSAIMADAKGAWKNLNMSANEYMATINDVGASFAMTMGSEKGYNTAKQGLQAIADYASGTGKSVDVLSEKFTMITRATSSYQSIADQFSGLLPATADGFLNAAQEAGFLSEKYKKLTEVPIDEYQAAVSAMLEQGARDMNLLGNTSEETEHTISGSIAGMKAAWGNLLADLGNSRASVGEDFDAFVSIAGKAAQNILGNLGKTVATAGTLIATKLPEIISNITSYIVDNIPSLTRSAVMFFFSIAYAVGEALPTIIAALPQIIGGVIGELLSPSNISAIKGAGLSLIQGLAEGISNAVDWVIDAIRSLCSDALEAVRNFFGIHSPSRVMMEMGGYIGEGLALGISGSESTVKGAMDGLMGAAYGRASMAGAGMAASFAGAGAYTANYTIGGINVTGDAEMEQAVLNVIGQLKRRGRI